MLDLLNQAAKRKNQQRIPFIIWNTAPIVISLLGIKHRQFYFDAALKLRTQLEIQNTFSDALLLPGAWPDFGVAVEPSFFGCDIEWPENDPPWVKSRITNVKEILHMTAVDPEKAGLGPEMLKQYRFMWRNIDRGYIERYGYLDGLGYTLGPLDTAAEIMGYSSFLLELYDHPKLIHNLLEMITDCLIRWLKAQEKVNGTLKRVLIPEHIYTQLSPEHFEEFCFPYINRIFLEFPSAIRLYHNEGDVYHIMDRIPEFGADIFHFGTDIKETKERIGKKICLMGNLDPLEVMLNGTLETVKETAQTCLEIGAKDGGFLLSTAGGMAPGTPIENIYAVIKVANTYSGIDT